MNTQAVSSVKIYEAASISGAQAESDESKRPATAKRSSFSAVPERGAEVLELRGRACDDVGHVTAYLCRHPEQLGLSPIRTAHDFGDAHGLNITRDGDRYIVQIRRFTVSEIFEGKPADEFLPDTHPLSPEKFATYLALEKEAQEAEKNIRFVTYFLRDRQKELSNITGGRLVEGQLGCEIARQLDGTFLIKITCRLTHEEFPRSYSKAQFNELVQHAQRTIEIETKQKNLKLVKEYLASHPTDTLGIPMTFNVSGVRRTVHPHTSFFEFSCELMEKPDGSYNLNVSYSILALIEGTPLQQQYAKTRDEWRSYKFDRVVTKAEFSTWLDAAKREEIAKLSAR